MFLDTMHPVQCIVVVDGGTMLLLLKLLQQQEYNICEWNTATGAPIVLEYKAISFVGWHYIPFIWSLLMLSLFLLQPFFLIDLLDLTIPKWSISPIWWCY